jgi:hypothetical protein
MSSSTNQPYSHNVFLSDLGTDDLTSIINDVNFLNTNAFLIDSSKPLTELVVGPTPAPLKLSLYAKLDNNLYIKNSLGVETLVSGGGGGVPSGTNFSDYLYWDNVLLDYAVGSNKVHLGSGSGVTNQGIDAIALGTSAGSSNQGVNAISIGTTAGNIGQSTNAIAIGNNCAPTSQGARSVAIGNNACGTSQAIDAIAIGTNAGTAQATNSIAIGNIAGQSQSANCVAIGPSAGNLSQGSGSVAIGLGAGATNQLANSVAIGTSAGNAGLQANCIAIGSQAAASSSVANSITLNGSGVNLPPTNSGFFVSPITSVGVTPTEFLGYNNTTKEIVRTSTLPVTPSVYAEIETSSTVTTKTFGALNTFEGFFSMTPGASNNVTVFNGSAVLPATFTINITGTYAFFGEIAIQKTVGAGSSNYRLQMFVNGLPAGIGSSVSTPNTTETVTCPLSFLGFATAGTVLELRMAQILGATPSTLSLLRVNFSGLILTAVPGTVGPTGPAGGGFNGSVSINSITSLGGLGPAALINGIPCNVGDTKNNSLGLTLTPTILGTIGATTQVFSGFIVGGVYMYNVHIALQATATVSARVVRLAQRYTSGVPNAVADVLQTSNIVTIAGIQSAALFNNWCFGSNLTGFFIGVTVTDKIWFSAESQVETVAYGGNSASPLTITITRVA